MHVCMYAWQGNKKTVSCTCNNYCQSADRPSNLISPTHMFHWPKVNLLGRLGYFISPTGDDSTVVYIKKLSLSVLANNSACDNSVCYPFAPTLAFRLAEFQHRFLGLIIINTHGSITTGRISGYNLMETFYWPLHVGLWLFGLGKKGFHRVGLPLTIAKMVGEPVCISH